MRNEDRIRLWREKRKKAENLTAIGKVENQETEDEGGRFSIADTKKAREAEMAVSQLPTTDDIELSKLNLLRSQIRALKRSWAIRSLFVGGGAAFLVGYFFFWQTPIYRADAVFTIQNFDRSATFVTPASGSLFNNGAGAQDLFWAREMILSRTMLNHMKQKGYFSQFRHGGVDFLSRPRIFPLLGLDDLDYFRRHVQVGVDAQEGLLKLHVDALSPDDAVRFSQEILYFAEGEVNRILSKIDADQLHELEKNVQIAQAGVEKAAADLSFLQVRRNEINPEQTANSVYQIVAGLEGQIADTEKEKEALYLNGQERNLALPALNARLLALRNQVARQRLRLTGGNHTRSVQGVLTEYEASLARKKIAESALDSALRTLEGARLQSIRQHRYLVVVAPPEAPQIPEKMQRIYWVMLVLVIIFLGYGLFTTLETMGRIRTGGRFPY